MFRLAGYRSGVYMFDGNRVLVTRSPQFLEPTPGKDKLIDEILEQMLGERQHRHFRAWCKLTDEAYRNGIGQICNAWCSLAQGIVASRACSIG
jgi:hypothetical protein